MLDHTSTCIHTDRNHWKRFCTCKKFLCYTTNSAHAYVSNKFSKNDITQNKTWGLGFISQPVQQLSLRRFQPSLAPAAFAKLTGNVVMPSLQSRLNSLWQITWQWWRVISEGLHNLYCLPNIIEIKSMRRWEIYVIQWDFRYMNTEVWWVNLKGTEGVGGGMHMAGSV